MEWERGVRCVAQCWIYCPAEMHFRSEAVPGADFKALWELLETISQQSKSFQLIKNLMRKPQVILCNLNNFLGCLEEKQFEWCSCCCYILCVGGQGGGTGIWGTRLWLLLCFILLVTVDVEQGEGDRRKLGCHGSCPMWMASLSIPAAALMGFSLWGTGRLCWQVVQGRCE